MDGERSDNDPLCIHNKNRRETLAIGKVPENIPRGPSHNNPLYVTQQKYERNSRDTERSENVPITIYDYPLSVRKKMKQAFCVDVYSA